MNQRQKIQQIENYLMGSGAIFELAGEDVMGERMAVFKNRPRSLRDLVLGSRTFGESEYLVFPNERITFEQHFRKVASVAAALKESFDVQPGDRVAILAGNCSEWIISFWATVSLGAIGVGLNGWWTQDEILYALKDCSPKVLLGDKKRLGRLEGSALDFPVIEFESQFESLLQFDDACGLPKNTIQEDDPAWILYTSGTTGRPKGATHSHRNIIALMGVQGFHGARAMQVRGLERPSQPVPFVTSPLFHVSGLYAVSVIALAAGSKTVWLPGRFDAEQALQAIQTEKVTGWGPMGVVANRLASHPKLKEYDLSSVTTVGFGGAPIPKSLLDQMGSVFEEAATGLGIGYGMTECTALATMNYGDDLDNHPNSVGRPLPTVQIEIRDNRGQPVDDGKEGEIYLRGPMVMLEYWNKPEVTAETIGEGRWLKTGDIGFMKEGRLYINSRARDLIIRSAENVYPAEIELRLDTHPSVQESAVVGVAHPELGQEVKAIVVQKQGGEATAEVLTSWVAETLAYFKVPAHFEFRTQPLPRNSVGKVQKHLI